MTTPLISLAKTGQQFSNLIYYIKFITIYIALYIAVTDWVLPPQSHNSTATLTTSPTISPSTSNSSILTPCVVWYSPPLLSVASPKILEIYVLPHYKERENNI